MKYCQKCVMPNTRPGISFEMVDANFFQTSTDSAINGGGGGQLYKDTLKNPLDSAKNPSKLESNNHKNAPAFHNLNIEASLSKVAQKQDFNSQQSGKIEVCSACINHEKKKLTNYEQRFKEFQKLCDKYRGSNGNSYDCAIAVSGGKDSHFQVHMMKEVMGLNPILFSVEDNFTMTEAGRHNLRNISEEFGCNLITIKPDIRLQKLLMKKCFEKYGKPTWLIDRLIYTYPIHMALKFNTPLLVYGENVSYEYGGSDSVETYSAREILSNGVASDIPLDELVDENISIKDLALTIAPSKEEIAKLDPIYLSYFVEWNSYSNYLFAKSRGFKDLTHEWDRTMTAENFDQVDSVAYLVHAWLKYPKFGHACATDYAARFVRYGMMNREEAKEMVRQRDHVLDPKAVEDFCRFVGYRESEFWKIIDGLYNREIFTKDGFGRWVLKNPVWEN